MGEREWVRESESLAQTTWLPFSSAFYNHLKCLFLKSGIVRHHEFNVFQLVDFRSKSPNTVEESVVNGLDSPLSSRLSLARNLSPLVSLSLALSCSRSTLDRSTFDTLSRFYLSKLSTTPTQNPESAVSASISTARDIAQPDFQSAARSLDNADWGTKKQTDSTLGVCVCVCAREREHPERERFSRLWKKGRFFARDGG